MRCEEALLDENSFKVRGGIRVVPRVGGGVRADSGWPMARLRADRASIVLHEVWAGTLMIGREDVTTIQPWHYALNRGIEFDVAGQDEIWIFRTYQGDKIMAGLVALGWNIES